MTKDGKYALKAEVYKSGKHSDIQNHPKDYKQPSVWPENDYTNPQACWYCLSGITSESVIQIERGDFIDEKNTDILDPISNQQSWRLVKNPAN
ncbi:hypothetical protein JTE88_06630 [Arcanobacterium phocisimile]|uniref:Ricin B lectin domain-containing protein n=1 Tax=Arcanobacterium phocisimile TaxID=1302235 RepID=A0ABX7IGS2_9ACTO|nr:hypothetical protein [Arcanobacterium phocisimile]QRV01764.1 hypothetical protein JTE88_06630 [Arcanobacterium phocisimile]